MRESYCIICGEEREGVEVKEDRVLSALRWFNRTILRIPPRNNSIVVCKSCYPTYKKQRKKYLGRQRTYLVLGFLFVLFGAIIAKTVVSIVVGLGLMVFLYLLSLLSYTPELKDISPKPAKGLSNPPPALKRRRKAK